MPLYPGCPGPSPLFLLILSIYLYTFLQKTPSLDVPRLDARGRCTPRTLLCTPLMTKLVQTLNLSDPHY